jgi:excisionase family DNA binding protein
MESEYLTIRQLSQYTSLHRNTLINWMKRGMPFYRIGRSVRVKRTDFDLWMRNNFQERAGGTPKKSLKDVLEETLMEVHA